MKETGGARGERMREATYRTIGILLASMLVLTVFSGGALAYSEEEVTNSQENDLNQEATAVAMGSNSVASPATAVALNIASQNNYATNLATDLG